MAATIIDGIIIALLLGSIAYGYSVSRRVQTLMAALKELEPLVQEFSTAVDKTEASVDQLRENIQHAEAQEQAGLFARAEDDAHDEEPAFASRRVHHPKMPGMHLVGDKRDLVRMFFDASRTESRA
jgi:hypothetical protein